MTERTSHPHPETVSALGVYWRLLKYLKHYWLVFIGSVLGMALFSSMEIAFVDLMGYLINVLTVMTGDGAVQQIAPGLTGSPGAVDKGFTATLADWLLVEGNVLQQSRVIIPVMLVGIAVLRGIGFLCGNYGMSYIAQSMVDKLRCQIFDKYTRMPSAYFDAQMSGHLVAQLTFHVQQVMGATTSALKVIVREGCLVIGLLAFLFYLNWRLALIFFIIMPFIAWIIRTVSLRFRRLSKRIQNAMGNVTQVSSEAVSGYREMRLFGGEHYERDRMLAASRHNRRQNLKLAVTQGVSTPIVQILVALAMAILVWLALAPDILQTMTTGGFTKFILTAGLLAKPVRQLTQINSTIQQGIAAGSVIFSTLDAAEEVDSGTQEKAQVAGGFEFRHLSFTYSTATEPALRDINFSVRSGETIALVGSSGSGKSTLVSLIPRFYNHCEGQILLDGIEVNDYRLANLRSHISLVSQQVTLFNDTVYNNIAYGELARQPREKVLEAAQLAHALEFIQALPQGFDTPIGDDGVMLSGGQRQRLAIARALLKNAPILILDEATSALDTESEQHIQAALEEVMKGRTTFVIAHRLSTVEKADRILVLEKGRLVEEGTHEALLAAGGRYARLYRKQFTEEVLPCYSGEAE